jgi:hypothetical protein
MMGGVALIGGEFTEQPLTWRMSNQLGQHIRTIRKIVDDEDEETSNKIIIPRALVPYKERVIDIATKIQPDQELKDKVMNIAYIFNHIFEKKLPFNDETKIMDITESLVTQLYAKNVRIPNDVKKTIDETIKEYQQKNPEWSKQSSSATESSSARASTSSSTESSSASATETASATSSARESAARASTSSATESETKSSTSSATELETKSSSSAATTSSRASVARASAARASTPAFKSASASRLASSLSTSSSEQHEHESYQIGESVTHVIFTDQTCVSFPDSLQSYFSVKDTLDRLRLLLAAGSSTSNIEFQDLTEDQTHAYESRLVDRWIGQVWSSWKRCQLWTQVDQNTYSPPPAVRSYNGLWKTCFDLTDRFHSYYGSKWHLIKCFWEAHMQTRPEFNLDHLMHFLAQQPLDTTSESSDPQAVWTNILKCPLFFEKGFQDTVQTPDVVSQYYQVYWQINHILSPEHSHQKSLNKMVEIYQSLSDCISSSQKWFDITGKQSRFIHPRIPTLNDLDQQVLGLVVAIQHHDQIQQWIRNYQTLCEAFEERQTQANICHCLNLKKENSTYKILSLYILQMWSVQLKVMNALFYFKTWVKTINSLIHESIRSESSIVNGDQWLTEKAQMFLKLKKKLGMMFEKARTFWLNNQKQEFEIECNQICDFIQVIQNRIQTADHVWLVFADLNHWTEESYKIPIPCSEVKIPDFRTTQNTINLSTELSYYISSTFGVGTQQSRQNNPLSVSSITDQLYGKNTQVHNRVIIRLLTGDNLATWTSKPPEIQSTLTNIVIFIDDSQASLYQRLVISLCKYKLILQRAWLQRQAQSGQKNNNKNHQNKESILSKELLLSGGIGIVMLSVVWILWRYGGNSRALRRQLRHMSVPGYEQSNLVSTLTTICPQWTGSETMETLEDNIQSLQQQSHKLRESFLSHFRRHGKIHLGLLLGLVIYLMINTWLQNQGYESLSNYFNNLFQDLSIIKGNRAETPEFASVSDNQLIQHLVKAKHWWSRWIRKSLGQSTPSIDKKPSVKRKTPSTKTLRRSSASRNQPSSRRSSASRNQPSSRRSSASRNQPSSRRSSAYRSSNA